MSRKPKDYRRVHWACGIANVLQLLAYGLDGEARAAVWLIAFGLVVYALWLLLRPDDDDFTGHRRRFQRLCWQG